jgi:hypothetical protein
MPWDCKTISGFSYSHLNGVSRIIAIVGSSGYLMVVANYSSAFEGAVLPVGTWLIVESGAERGCITHISADGQTFTDRRNPEFRRLSWGQGSQPGRNLAILRTKGGGAPERFPRRCPVWVSYSALLSGWD